VSDDLGINWLPHSVAYLQAFAKTKTIKECYDTPHVKGLLSITMHISRQAEGGSCRKFTLRKTLEERCAPEEWCAPEAKELCMVCCKNKLVRTAVEDARRDVISCWMVTEASIQGEHDRRSLFWFVERQAHCRLFTSVYRSARTCEGALQDNTP